MFYNLLSATASTDSTSASGGAGTQQIIIWIILGVFLVGLIVMNFLSNKKRKAQMEAEKEKRNAIKPGFKVMTIGGIVGTVVSVDDEANSFVLQTGTDENPNYIKFDKVAIYSSEDPNEAANHEDVHEDIHEELHSDAPAAEAASAAEETHEDGENSDKE